jgi:tape measure domain-containing protein
MASFTVDELITKYTLDSKGYVAGSHQVIKATQRTDGHISTLTRSVRSSGGQVDSLTDSWKFAAAELDSSTPVLGEVVSILKAFAIAATGAAIALAGFGVLAMRQGAEFESLRLGLSAYTADADELERVWKRLREVARLPGLGFEEAIRGSVRLQAAGFNARLAERALLSFGNALAAVGGGREELDGVLLALTQIASKSQVSAEEINQIAERVPQIRQIMLEAFGTANTEELAKRGIDPRAFLVKIIDVLEKLPRVAGGTKNAFENIGDAIKNAVADIGTVLNTALVPHLEKVTSFVDYLSESGILKGIADQFTRILTGGPAEGAFDSVVRAATAASALFRNAAEWLAQGEGLADTLVRGASLFVAAFERLPDIISLALRMIEESANALRGFINLIIDAINAVLKQFVGEGLSIKLFGRDIGKIGGGGNFQALPKIDEFGFSEDTKNAGRGLMDGILDRAKGIYGGFLGFSPTDSVSGDKSKGGFRSQMDDQTRLLREIAFNTEPLRIDYSRNILGGGDLGRLGVTPVELGGVLGRSRPIRIEAPKGPMVITDAEAFVIDIVKQLRRQGALA